MTTTAEHDRPKSGEGAQSHGARTAISPTRFGRFVVDAGDGVAVQHLVQHHLLAADPRERLGLWGAKRALRWGWSGLAGAALRAGYGRGPTGPLEVEAVWSVVRDTLRACSLAGVRIRIHLLDDPVAGLGRGGVLFGFGRRGSSADPATPVVVLKVRPGAAEAGSLGREAAGLRAVRAHLPDRLRGTLPEALAHRVSDGVEVLATSFVPGCPVHLHLRDARSEQVAHGHLAAVTRWLAELQDACPPARDRVVDGSTWPEEADGHAWGAELRERLARTPLPLLDSHGDFQARNVLCSRGSVSGVVDWGRHRPDSIPTRDLFHFLITYARLGSRRRPIQAFRRAFVDRTRLSQAVRQALVRYGHLRGLDLDVLGGLFRMHLLLVDRGGGPRDPLPNPSDRQAALRLLTTAGETVFTP